jgi:hypothetical protein
MLKFRPDAHVAPVRDDDGVRIDTGHAPDGSITRVALDFGGRTTDRHCLVTLPPLAWSPTEEPAPTWLRFLVTYDGAVERTPFIAMVTWYWHGEAEREERLRFFAGADPAQICLPLTQDEVCDSVQVTLYADRMSSGVIELDDVAVVVAGRRRRFGGTDPLGEPLDLTKAWRQEGTRVICSSFFGEHYAEMPEDWSLSDVHPAALRAAEWFLYDKLESVFVGRPQTRLTADEASRRKPGEALLLSFSLGVDSCAAATLLSAAEPLHLYCRRDFDTYLTSAGARISMASVDAVDRGMELTPRLTVVPNTFELARVAAGGAIGFSHGYGYAAISLLLADHLEAGALALGSVMEQVFLRSGNRYADIVSNTSSLVSGVKAALSSGGLDLTLPVAGCSEVATSRISRRGPFGGVAIWCPRADSDGRPCGVCFKCFRKLRFDRDGEGAPHPEQAVLDLLVKRPLKSATSVVYACQRGGFSAPGVNEYLGLDLTFLERYYDYAVEHLVPERYHATVRSALAAAGVEPMGPDDEGRLVAVGDVFDPPLQRRRRWGRVGRTG